MFAGRRVNQTSELLKRRTEPGTIVSHRLQGGTVESVVVNTAINDGPQRNPFTAILIEGHRHGDTLKAGGLVPVALTHLHFGFVNETQVPLRFWLIQHL